MDANERDVSSLMDCWISLNTVESAGERHRNLYILKSRGMSHSNQVRRFLFSSRGIQVGDIEGPAAAAPLP